MRKEYECLTHDDAVVTRGLSASDSVCQECRGLSHSGPRLSGKLFHAKIIMNSSVSEIF